VVFYFDDDRLIGHEFCFRLLSTNPIEYQLGRADQVIFGIWGSRRSTAPIARSA
jgi:hypothetical protein